MLHTRQEVEARRNIKHIHLQYADEAGGQRAPRSSSCTQNLNVMRKADKEN